MLVQYSINHDKTIAGTAGVWRISALIEAGGWKDRTTVEDMDLAVRASLKGWKFVYIGDLKVLVYAILINDPTILLLVIYTYCNSKYSSKYI